MDFKMLQNFPVMDIKMLQNFERLFKKATNSFNCCRTFKPFYNSAATLKFGPIDAAAMTFIEVTGGLVSCLRLPERITGTIAFHFH